MESKSFIEVTADDAMDKASEFIREKRKENPKFIPQYIGVSYFHDMEDIWRVTIFY